MFGVYLVFESSREVYSCVQFWCHFLGLLILFELAWYTFALVKI